ncbi:MAG TPA: zinc ribbon domain-containing protein [Clostridiaceae bacterium]|nr:zinc ribbon domain-containing protein [Clostridiaceae bacterium]
MAYCKTCGFQMDDSATFCPQCGTPVAQQVEGSPGQAPPPHQHQHQHHAPPPPPAFMNTPDSTGQFTQEDINANKAMGVLSYLGILVLIPLFAAKESKFARFHANQGLILLILYGILMVFRILLGAIWRVRYFYVSIAHPGVTWLTLLLSLPLLALSIIGIVNVVNGRAKELPVVGKFKLIK